MELDPDLTYQTCPQCGGLGPPCTNCIDGLVPHGCKDGTDTTDLVGEDEVARLVALDDQIKADLHRDAEIAAHLRHSLLDQGFSEKAAESMALSWYESWTNPFQ